MSADHTILHNRQASRFEVTVDGHLSVADYTLDGNRLLMTHTEVPTALAGRGIAGALVKAALAWAEQDGLQVVPLCSYVRGYMERHPETARLRAPT